MPENTDNDVSKESTFRSIYDDTTFFIDNIIDEYEVYPTIIEKMRSGNATMELRKRYFLRAIDETWVNAIEEVIPALDYIIRNPSKFIEEKEELIPVELTRKVSVRTLQHLSQHTNYIQDVKGDEITPSMLLNVFKDETFMTYDNKFVNTLINRLFMFINRRYEIALKAGQDEKTTSIEFKEDFLHDKIKVKMNFQIEISEQSGGLDDRVERNYSYTTDLWKRVEKLNSILTTYVTSEFCMQMGHNYIRPPVMRTNAIMKNKNLRQCYELWQFLDTYDGAGYSMLLQENLEKIDEGYIKEMYSTMAIQYMLFRYNIRNEFEFDSTLASTLSKEELKPRIIDELDNTSEHEFDLGEKPQPEKVAKTPAEKRYSTMTPEDQIILQSLDVAMEADAIINDRDEGFLYSKGEIPEPQPVPNDALSVNEVPEPAQEEAADETAEETADTAQEIPEEPVFEETGIPAEADAFAEIPSDEPEDAAPEALGAAEDTDAAPEALGTTEDTEELQKEPEETPDSPEQVNTTEAEPEQETVTKPEQEQEASAEPEQTDAPEDTKEKDEFLSGLIFPFENRTEDDAKND